MNAAGDAEQTRLAEFRSPWDLTAGVVTRNREPGSPEWWRLYRAEPCTAERGDPEPGVRLLRAEELFNRLTPAEARELAVSLLSAADASEAGWIASPGPEVPS